MADASAWMPLYVGDYLGDTQRLTTEQHGAYFLLLIDYWRNGPPPDDDAVLAQITRMERADWQRVKRVILKFFEEQDGLLIHGRVERELEKAKTNVEKRVERAKVAAEARWHRDASSNASSNARSNAPSNAPRKRQASPKALLEECPPPSPSSNDDRNPPLVPPSRKRSLPDEWEPEPFTVGTQCRSIVDGWSPSEFERQVESFKAHHEREGSKFVNWQAAWKTWALNSVKFGNQRDRDGGSTWRKSEDLLEIVIRENGVKVPP